MSLEAMQECPIVQKRLERKRAREEAGPTPAFLRAAATGIHDHEIIRSLEKAILEQEVNPDDAFIFVYLNIVKESTLPNCQWWREVCAWNAQQKHGILTLQSNIYHAHWVDITAIVARCWNNKYPSEECIVNGYSLKFKL